MLYKGEAAIEPQTRSKYLLSVSGKSGQTGRMHV